MRSERGASFFIKGYNRYMKHLIVILIVLMTGCGYGIRSGEGKKIGQVVKLGEYGMLCKTYEGELVRGGLNNGSGVNGSSFHFSMKSKEMFDKLNKMMEDQQEIEITYQKSNFSGVCSGDAGVWVTDFKVLALPQRPDQKESKRQELLKQLKELQ